MKRFTFAIILVLAFCADSFALNLRPYMQTPPEVQVFAKRVIEDGGQVVDLEYCQKYTRLSKQLMIWSNGKFVGDANMGVKLNSGVSVQTLYDLSGNNNDATSGVTVNNQPVWTKNVQGGRAGLVFDGTNDYLAKTDEDSLDMTVVTVNSVINRAVDGSTGTILTKRNGGTNYLLGIYNDANNNVLISWNGATTVNANTTVTANVTYNVMAQWTGTNVNYFLNGSADGTPAQIIGAVNIGNLVIGWDTSGSDPNNYFHGKILNISVLNLALTTDRRTAIEAFLNAYYSIY